MLLFRYQLLQAAMLQLLVEVKVSINYWQQVLSKQLTILLR